MTMYRAPCSPAASRRVYRIWASVIWQNSSWKQLPKTIREIHGSGKNTQERHGGDKRQRWRRIAPYSLFALVGVGYLHLQANDDTSTKPLLQTPQFTRFTITQKQAVTPQTFVLTLRPSQLVSARAQLPTDRSDEAYPLFDSAIWAVEFKHPLLQIARSYTPLPPDAQTAWGDLRFLIKHEVGGEVSSYIAGLTVGEELELRGPKVQVNLSREPVSQIVFVAGGTGIAPACQTAAALLQRSKTITDRTKITILWAVRSRQECCQGPVAQALAELEKQHPTQLHVERFIDDEKTFLADSHLARTLASIDESSQKLLLISGPERLTSWLVGRVSMQDEGRLQSPTVIRGLLGRLLRHDACWKVCYL